MSTTNKHYTYNLFKYLDGTSSTHYSSYKQVIIKIVKRLKNFLIISINNLLQKQCLYDLLTVNYTYAVSCQFLVSLHILLYKIVQNKHYKLKNTI